MAYGRWPFAHADGLILDQGKVSAAMAMRILHRCGGVLLGLWLATNCAQPAAADVSISGSSTILPIVKKAADPFAAKTGIRLRMEGGGSDRGIQDALAGKVDLGMVSRALHGDEAAQLHAYTIGYDGLAIIVNARNFLAAIDKETVRRIYAGDLANWRDVGGANVPIAVVHKEHGRSTRELFDRYFGLAGQELPSAFLIGPNLASLLYVAADPHAIGYVSIGRTAYAQSKGLAVKTLRFEGVDATMDNVRNGSYPINRPLNLVYRGQPSAEAQRFLAFMQGAEGAAVVAAEGFATVVADDGKGLLPDSERAP